MSEVFIGQINAFGFGWAPKGWALCAGQLLSINQNTALFSLIGTTYGGNGQSSFALPNTQSRVMNHFGAGPGLSTYSMGEASGAEMTSLNSTQLPRHNHLVTASGSAATSSSPAGHFFALGNGTDDGTGNPVTVQIFSPPSVPTMQPTSTAGGSVPFSIIQPFNTVSNCISLYGIYPSRN